MEVNLIGKKVKLNTRKGYFYSGKLLSIGSDMVYIDDKIKGIIAIPIENVEIIEEVKE